MKKIGVIGAGTMGLGIAQVAAFSGNEVCLFDSFTPLLSEVKGKIEKSLQVLVSKGKLEQNKVSEVLSRITLSESLAEFSACELVIEAIIEKREAKAFVFHHLYAIVSPTCIVASNTSSLSISSLASFSKNPERFIGIHFFNPAPVMKLVEIIPAVQTSEHTIAETQKIITAWGKIPVLAKDTPGFIVNRVARPFYGEALRIYDEGIADFATIDWAMKTFGGFPMGPFELMDFIGNDINYTVTESIFQSFFCDPRYMPSFTQKRLMEAGYLGKKSGRGYYSYQNKAIKPEPNEDHELGKTIFKRILVMLINEAAEALHYGIASSTDIEMAMTKGVNYPKGLLKWADELGILEVVNHLDELFETYHDSRYRCSVLLRKMTHKDLSFY